MKYTVTGYLNKNNTEIRKDFKSLDKANRFLDSVLTAYDCQVESNETEGKITKYICDDFTRFYVEERI